MLDEIMEFSQELWCLMISLILSKGFAWWDHRVQPRALMLDDIIDFIQGLCLMRSSSAAKSFDAGWYHRVFGFYHETMASTLSWDHGIHPQGAPLAGCRCLPLIGDDMSHDALMWGHGGKHVRKPEHFAWPVHFPWGQPPYRMGKSGRPHICSTHQKAYFSCFAEVFSWLRLCWCSMSGCTHFFVVSWYHQGFLPVPQRAMRVFDDDIFEVLVVLFLSSRYHPIFFAILVLPRAYEQVLLQFVFSNLVNPDQTTNWRGMAEWIQLHGIQTKIPTPSMWNMHETSRPHTCPGGAFSCACCSTKALPHTSKTSILRSF